MDSAALVADKDALVDGSPCWIYNNPTTNDSMNTFEKKSHLLNSALENKLPTAPQSAQLSMIFRPNLGLDIIDKYYLPEGFIKKDVCDSA